MHHTWRSRNDRKYSNHQELQSGCGLTGLTQRRYTHNGAITGTSRGYLFRKAEHHFKAWNFLVEAAQIVSGLRLSRKCVIRAWKLQIKGDSLFSVCVARLVIESNLIEEILSASGEHPSPSTETQTSPKQRKLTRHFFFWAELIIFLHRLTIVSYCHRAHFGWVWAQIQRPLIPRLSRWWRWSDRCTSPLHLHLCLVRAGMCEAGNLMEKPNQTVLWANDFRTAQTLRKKYKPQYFSHISLCLPLSL